MVEPVGLLGTVVGVVSLGLQVHKSLKEYLDAFKSRDKRVDQALIRLKLLQQSLKIIESITPSLENEYQEPTGAVMSSLREAQADLQALRDKLQKNKPLDPTNLIEKVKEKKKKLAFPFRISDLDKLESTLDKIVKNLSIAMQVLGLNISSVIDTKVSNISPQLDTLTAISRDIQATQATEAARQIDVQSTLNLGLQVIEHSTSHIADQVSVLVPNTQSLLDEVLKIGQNIDLVLKNQSSLPDSETLHRIAASMMVAKPALLSTACDAVNSNSIALSGLTTINSQDDIPQDFALEANRKSRTSCNCRYHRRITRKLYSWFIFSTFEELVTESRHKPWCPLFQPMTSVNYRRFGVVIAGLHRYLSTAVSVSLCMTHGAGGRSISPTIRYFGMVERKKSPSFRIIQSLSDIMYKKRDNNSWSLWDSGLRDKDILDPSLLHVLSFEEIVRTGISKLRQIYGSGAALPTDVDECGRTVMHVIFDGGILQYLEAMGGMDGLNEFDYLVRALLDLGIPCTTPAELDTSIIDKCLVADLLVRHLFSRPARNFILKDILINLLRRETFDNTIPRIVDLVNFRDSIAESELLAEALDLDSPICTALLHRNEDDLRRLLRDSPTSSLVENSNRLTFAHLAIGWPPGLKILLDMIPDLDIDSQYCRESPFMLAMRQSGLTCCKGRAAENCSNCNCTEAVEILLHANCYIPFESIKYMLRRSLRPSSSIASLSFCSSRASLVLLEHIKTWRNKLKSLLFEHIPETKLSGRYDSPVLDMRAGEAIADLERRGIFPFQQYNLQPDDYRLGSRGGATIYHSVHDHRIAEKAFELGFRDVDGVFNGQTPLLVTIEKNPRMTPYVNWLIAHGSSYTSRLFYTNTHINTLLHRTISHMLLEQLALSVHSYLQDGLDPEGACLDNLRLLSKVSIGDGCTCSCSKSSDGCYPMTIFISTFLKVYLGSRSKYAQDIHSYYRKGVIWICEKLLNFVAKKDKFDIITEAILRGLTFDYFTLLHLLHTSIPTELHGIRHTCCICLSPYYYVRYKDIKPSQDELETYGGYHEKDHVLLRKLDELVVEFTEQFSLVPYPLSEFIENCWFPRMNEVVHELSMSYSSQAEITEEEDDDSNEDSKVSDLDVVLKLPGAF